MKKVITTTTYICNRCGKETTEEFFPVVDFTRIHIKTELSGGELTYCRECSEMIHDVLTGSGLGFMKNMNSQAQKRVDIAIRALSELSRLGNGEKQGNSTGNVIAKDALKQMDGVK